MDISKHQYDRLKSAFQNGAGYRLKYTKDSIDEISGDGLNKRLVNKIENAKQEGKGLILNLTNEQVKKVIDQNKSKFDDEEEITNTYGCGFKLNKNMSEQHKLGHKVLTSDLSNKLVKKLYNVVIIPKLEKEKSKHIPKFDTKMKDFLIALLSNSKDFVDLINQDLTKDETDKIVKALTTELGKSGSGFLDSVKSGLKSLYGVVKAVANGTVNVIKNTGTKFVEKFNDRYSTPEGLAKTIGGFASDAVEVSIAGEPEAIPVVIGTEIIGNMVSDLGKSFLEAFSDEVSSSLAPNNVSNEPDDGYYENTQQYNPYYTNEDNIVGNGNHEINRYIDIILSKN